MNLTTFPRWTPWPRHSKSTERALQDGRYDLDLLNEMVRFITLFPYSQGTQHDSEWPYYTRPAGVR